MLFMFEPSSNPATKAGPPNDLLRQTSKMAPTFGLWWPLMPLLASLALAQSSGSFQCSNSSSAAYNATFTNLGCYNDSSVSILSAAKLSTIAMTPSYCASWCGERGYGYGGINFGTQCFCGNEPNFSNANEIDEDRCQPCTTDPASKCGAGYV